jgi:uncharacterized protein (DUF1778 family)
MPQPKPKPRRVGRPTLPKGHAKASKIQVRLSPKEQARIEAAAKAKGQTVSEWIRSLISAAA